MANEEQLSILKQGVDVWNKWRSTNLGIKIDFRGADLMKANLPGADLIRADLRDASFEGANFEDAYLSEADLRGSNLSGANFRKTNLRAANLQGTDLYNVVLDHAVLDQARFSFARIGEAIFTNLDLRTVIGLADAIYIAPCTVGANVIALAEGKIPDPFLRGCGLSDWEIEAVKLHNLGLTNNERNQILYKIYDLQTSQAIQISPLFISYSHGDTEFVNKIDTHLTQKGVRFWRDIHDLKAGRIEKQIDSAISQGRTVLLILSQHSLSSDWVEHEVRTARGLEKEFGRDVLCPVALDDNWKDSHWPKRIMEQIMEYNILDFSEWQDDTKFDRMFRKLIDGLELFYKG